MEVVRGRQDGWIGGRRKEEGKERRHGEEGKRRARRGGREWRRSVFCKFETIYATNIAAYDLAHREPFANRVLPDRCLRAIFGARLHGQTRRQSAWVASCAAGV